MSAVTLTTGQSATLALQGEVERSKPISALKAFPMVRWESSRMRSRKRSTVYQYVAVNLELEF